MSEDEYYNNILVIYLLLLKAIKSESKSAIYGYIASAMNVVEAIYKKKGN